MSASIRYNSIGRDERVDEAAKVEAAIQYIKNASCYQSSSR